MNILRATFAGLLLGLAIDLSAAPGSTEVGEVWPRFRGIDGAGRSSSRNLPAAWTEKDYNWNVKLPGRGHSSPCVWGERVFVSAGDKTTATRYLLGLNRWTGQIEWQKTYESKPSRLNNLNSYATSSPAADEDQVYFYWTTPEQITLVALSHTGREIWQRNLGSFASQHGSGTSPIVVGDLVILTNDQDGPSSIMALDRKTGETRWNLDRQRGQTAYSTPFVYTPANGSAQLIITSSSHGVTSVDARSGQVNWEYRNAFPLRVVGSPAMAGGLVIATCGEGGVGKRLVAIQPPGPGSAQEPKLAYEFKKSIPYVPTPLAVGEFLFLWGDNGLVSCRQPKTGEIVWEKKLADSFLGSPVYGDGRIYCISKAGVVHVLAASSQYQYLGSNPLADESESTPAIAGGTLYLRTATQLISVGGKRPAIGPAIP